MATKTTKTTAKAPEAPEAPEMAPAVVKAMEACVRSGGALTALEASSGDALISAHRTFGDDVRTLASERAKASGKVLALTTWSDIRGVIFAGEASGSGRLAGRSEASVQRSVKISMWFPNGDAVKAWRDHRTMVLASVESAKDKLSKATTDTAKAKASADLAKAKANADSPAYRSDGLVAMISYGDAKHDPKGSRLNSRTGVITGKGSNRQQSDAMVTASDRVDGARSALEMVADETADPEQREEADSFAVAPGVTLGMLRLMSEADLRALASVALDMAKAKAKAPKAKASPVPPVLAPKAETPSPLAGVAPETLDALRSLLAAIPS